MSFFWFFTGIVVVALTLKLLQTSLRD